MVVRSHLASGGKKQERKVTYAELRLMLLEYDQILELSQGFRFKVDDLRLPNMRIQLLKSIRYLLCFLGGVLFLYLLAALLLSLIPTRPAHAECQNANNVFITTNGVHLDLILPRELIPDPLLHQLYLPRWVQ